MDVDVDVDSAPPPVAPDTPPTATALAGFKFIEEYSPPPPSRPRSSSFSVSNPNITLYSPERPPPPRRNPFRASTLFANVGGGGGGGGEGGGGGGGRGGRPLSGIQAFSYSSSAPTTDSNTLIRKIKKQKSPLSYSDSVVGEVSVEQSGGGEEQNAVDGVEQESVQVKVREEGEVQDTSSFAQTKVFPTAISSLFRSISSNIISNKPNGGYNSCPTMPTVKDLEKSGLSRKMTIEGPVFGYPLPELIAKESRIARYEFKILVPYVVEDCIVHLMNEDAMKLEGIFRQSGRAVDIADIRNLYNKGKYLNLREYPDMYTVASLLKLYLRELPEPLITYNLYSSLLDLSKILSENENGPLDAVRECIKLLPLENKCILKVLTALLARIATYESFNKMTPSNLAIVMGPNIMWTKVQAATIDAVNDSLAINHFTTILIDHQEYLFSEDEDTADVTLDNLQQQHKTILARFPSFAEAQKEDKIQQSQQPHQQGTLRKKSSFSFLKMM